MTTPQDPVQEPLIARDATYHRAPEALKERVRAAIRQEAREPAPRAEWWRWGGMAASIVVSGLLAWNGVLLQSGSRAEDRLAAEITTAHIRSLMAEGHLNDVASSDRHTVKPWFQGRLDFAPNVMDLAEAGFPLTGGRLDYVDGRAVAALTYKHRLHVINLFEWPTAAPADKAPEPFTRQGYSLVRWKRGNLQYVAVSDGSTADLMEFARRYPGD
jgi:anti-sigma factor RsiW